MALKMVAFLAECGFLTFVTKLSCCAMDKEENPIAKKQKIKDLKIL
jgi:hypothetical protein